MANFNNPFGEALKNFTPEKKEEPKAKPLEPKIIQPDKISAPEDQPEQVWRHPKTGLLKEDQEAFESLCRLIGLSERGKDKNRYWRVRDCFRDSHNTDVSYHINRWLGGELLSFGSPLSTDSEETRRKFKETLSKIEKVKAIIGPLLKRGHEARAVDWLLSRTPEKMKYGNGSRELRLEEAKKSAQKAGKTIEEIAKTHGLENLL